MGEVLVLCKILLMHVVPVRDRTINQGLNTNTSPVSLQVVSTSTEHSLRSMNPFELSSKYERQNPNMGTISSIEGVRHSKAYTCPQQS